MPRSIIEYFAGNDRSKCGYCKQPNSSYSHGLWAHSMSVSDYQDLIDRGWRRSGKYCYKPTLDIICCPMYTIRCRALEFKASKSQKKVLKRFNKYLSGEYEFASAERNASCSREEMDIDECGEQFVKSKRDPLKIDIGADLKFIDSPDSNSEGCLVKPSCANQKSETNTTKENNIKDQGPDPSKPPCKKAKQLRIERKFEKLRAQGKDVNILINNKNKEKQIEDFIKDLPEGAKNKLEIKLVRTTPPSVEWFATANETHAVYVKYQMAVHGDTIEKCAEPNFRDFLVQSPLVEEYSEVGPPCGYGSFHQQYRLNGRIIAVGVLDILPKCVSSVYFFYDPQYTNLTMGTYGTLRELEFTRHLHVTCPELKYYYMGFYIHSCKKMRYKGAYTPSDLLCPETYNWFPIQECIPKLEQSPYSRFDPDLSAVDRNKPSDDDINFIPVLSNRQVLPFQVYRKKARTDDRDVLQYATLVGAKCAHSLILVR